MNQHLYRSSILIETVSAETTYLLHLEWRMSRKRTSKISPQTHAHTHVRFSINIIVKGINHSAKYAMEKCDTWMGECVWRNKKILSQDLFLDSISFIRRSPRKTWSKKQLKPPPHSLRMINIWIYSNFKEILYYAYIHISHRMYVLMNLLRHRP